MKKFMKRVAAAALAAALALGTFGTASAAETVKVTVPNVRGGYLRVTYYDGTRTVVLPVGATTQVPKGMTLRVYEQPFTYYPDGNTVWKSSLNLLEANGEALDSYEARRGIAADEDIVFEAAFKGEERKTTDAAAAMPELCFVNGTEYDPYTGMFAAGRLPEKKLTVYDWENDRNFGFKAENIEILDVYGCDENGIDLELDPDLFSISEAGTFSAKDPLSKGEYSIFGEFDYENTRYDFYLSVYVGASVTIGIPMVTTKTSPDGRKTVRGGTFDIVYLDDYRTNTYADAFGKYKNKEGHAVLSGYEPTGLGVFNSSQGEITSVMDKKVANDITEAYPSSYRYLMLKNYKIPYVEPLTEADIVGRKVNQGWNRSSDGWRYYRTEESESLAVNTWIDECPCPENKERVWVGADGLMATNKVILADSVEYLVNENGHVWKNASTTVDGMDIKTDADGVVTEKKIHLATPSNAEEIKKQTDTVLANKDSLTEEELHRAADMLTEALKKGAVKTADLTDADIEKYEELYKAAFGEGNIIADPAVKGGIAAAGLTSADFADGAATVEYRTVWLGTSGNAQERLSVKLFVNDVERTVFTAPVSMTVDLPDTFIASYSNAKYNFKFDGKTADVNTDEGIIKIRILKPDVYNLTAVKKSTGSSGGSSSGRAPRAVATTNNMSRSGQWIQGTNGWWFQFEDGTWPANRWEYLNWNGTGNWYYFDANGYMATGWILWEGRYYYLHPIADGNKGCMLTGWQEIGGKWYYFNTNVSPIGAMLSNGTTPDGYKVNADGEWIR